MPPEAQRKILLRGDGGLFAVEVLPPLTEGAGFDQSFATYRGARGYAAGLRTVLNLELVDRCEPDR